MIQWMGNLCWDKLSSSAGLNCLSLKWLQSAGGSAGAHGPGGNPKPYQCANPKLLLPRSLLWSLGWSGLSHPVQG